MKTKEVLCLQISQTQRAPYLSGNELFQLKIIGQLIFLHNKKKTLSHFLVGSLEVDQLFRNFCPKYVSIQGALALKITRFTPYFQFYAPLLMRKSSNPLQFS